MLVTHREPLDFTSVNTSGNNLEKNKAFWYSMGEEGTLLMLIWGVLLHKQRTDDKT